MSFSVSHRTPYSFSITSFLSTQPCFYLLLPAIIRTAVHYKIVLLEEHVPVLHQFHFAIAPKHLPPCREQQEPQFEGAVVTRREREKTEDVLSISC